MPNSPTYDTITIIFNPNSTGDAPQLAQELATQLAERLPGVPTTLTETEHAGHAEELAKTAAHKSKKPLIISVSGDGGYHEVVNGVMSAGNPGAVAAVHAAGNANDHRSATRERPLIESIVSGPVTPLDLIKIEVTGGPLRYAHSYAGLGVTPAVAVELNRHSLNRLKEIQLVYQTLRDFRPFQIRRNHTLYTLDSLVFANIGRMARMLKLGADNPDDGHFAVTTIPHRSKLRLLLTGLRLVTLGPAKAPDMTTYSFELIKSQPMQLDGELLDLPAAAQVTVTSAHGALSTLL